MTATPRVEVLSRVGCHLCEQAIEVVEAVCAQTGDTFSVTDVDSDAELVRRYGDQVPVTFVDGRQHDFWRVDARASDAGPGSYALTVLFTAATLAGLSQGSISCTYRRWTVVRPRPGSRFTTRAGLVEVTSIERVDEDALTESDARAGGFATLAALRKWTDAKGEGDLYRIGIALAGPDPRVALRETAELDPGEVVALNATLDRMDRAAERPWTRDTLRQIERQPGTVSTELAAEAGVERAFYKIRVRRLKALGLTESLEVGYRLSPRGASYLRANG